MLGHFALMSLLSLEVSVIIPILETEGKLTASQSTQQAWTWPSWALSLLMPLLNTSWSQGGQVGNEWVDTRDAWESSQNIRTVTPLCGLIVLVNPVENGSIVTSVDQWLLGQGLTSWEELKIFTHLNLVTGTYSVCYIIKWMSLRSRFWADEKADNLII